MFAHDLWEPMPHIRLEWCLLNWPCMRLELVKRDFSHFVFEIVICSSHYSHCSLQQWENKKRNIVATFLSSLMLHQQQQKTHKLCLVHILTNHLELKCVSLSLSLLKREKCLKSVRWRFVKWKSHWAPHVVRNLWVKILGTLNSGHEGARHAYEVRTQMWLRC